MEEVIRTIELPYNRSLVIHITSEGLIIDAYDDGGQELLGTSGMTFEEWYENLADQSNWEGM